MVSYSLLYKTKCLELKLKLKLKLIMTIVSLLSNDVS